MSEFRYLYPRNRLAAMVDLPDGVTIDEALARAHDNVEAMRDECESTIDEMIAELHTLLPAGNDDPGEERLMRMYQISNDVVGAAVTLDLRDVSRAAYSFCELIDRQRTRGSWSQRSAQVHIEALRLLREPGGNAGGREAILAGLERVLYFAR